MRIIASRVGRSRARPPIGASALGVAAARERAATRHDRPRRYGPPTKEPRGRNARAAEPLFLFFSFLHTEGIINICYSAYGARAAPFHPTIRPTGRTLNTLSPSLYVQVARHTRSGIVESPRSRSSVKENLYLLSAARFVCLSLSHSHPLARVEFRDQPTPCTGTGKAAIILETLLILDEVESEESKVPREGERTPFAVRESLFHSHCRSMRGGSLVARFREPLAAGIPVTFAGTEQGKR